MKILKLTIFFIVILYKQNSFSQFIIIGTQTWMTKNLDVSTFRNGDSIPEVKTDEEWKKAGENKQPAWCYYDNDQKNGEKYGKLYNWYAVSDPRGLAPEGWRIPSESDWSYLINNFGGRFYANGKLKSNSGWDSGAFGKWFKNQNGTNESGFSGLPGGERDDFGKFYGIGDNGYWWSCTGGSGSLIGAAWGCELTYQFNGHADLLPCDKRYGYSVRSLKEIHGEINQVSTSLKQTATPNLTNQENITSKVVSFPKCLKGDCNNGYGECQYSDGIYSGYWQNGKRNGNGVFENSNGDSYSGQYFDDKLNGKGKYQWKNGEIYEGDWVNNNRTGKGKFYFANGHIYEGDFFEGLYNGIGKITWKDGEVYEGEWKNGQRTGKGKYIFSNGEIYEGDWLNGQKSGKGKYIFSNGDIYEGDWFGDNRNGKGKYQWKNGDMYDGDWMNDQINGKGIKIQFNGNVYEGDWKNGKKDGKGIYRQKNGAVYEGDWSNDQNTGKGKYIFSNGDVYMGDFVNNKFHGKGKFQWSNGDIYEGDWVHDQMSGNSQIIRAKTQQNNNANTANNYKNESQNFQNNYERKQNNIPINSIEVFEDKVNFKTKWIAKEIDRFMFPDFIKFDFYFRPSWRYLEDKTEIKDRLYYEEIPYSGTYIYRYRNKNEYEIINFKDGYLDGKSTIYFNDGEIAEFNYKEGRRYGLQQEFYKNGKKKQYGNLVNGNGILTEWHEDGKIAKMSTYKNGLLNGVQKEFSSISENELISELNYKDGKLDGRANDRGRLFGNYSNGKFNGIQKVSDFINEFEVLFSMDTFKLIIKSKKHIIQYIPGEKKEKKIEHEFGLYNKNYLHGIESSYVKKDTNIYLQSQGKIIRTSLNFTEDEVVDYINACGAGRRDEFILEEVKKAWNGYVFCKISKDSIWKTWHPNGLLESFGNYTNNLKNGIWKEWHSNGILASSGTYISDQKNGSWKSYNAAGQLISDENYSNGKKNGLFTKYFDNGKVSIIENYIDDIKVGSWKRYNENGIVTIEETYKNGLKDGISITRHNNGIKSSEATYKDGALVGEFKRFDEKGNLIKPPVIVNNNTNQGNTNTSQNYTQVKEKCFTCSGSGNCSYCNKFFNVKYWGGKNKGWVVEQKMSPGYILCTGCDGSSLDYGPFNGNPDPSSKDCSACGNGWNECNKCYWQSKGKCDRCNGTGFVE